MSRTSSRTRRAKFHKRPRSLFLEQLEHRSLLAAVITVNSADDTDTRDSVLTFVRRLRSTTVAERGAFDGRGAGPSNWYGFNSTPGSSFRIQFFGNAVADPSLHGEGQTFLGSIDVTTDTDGNVSPTPFSFSPASPLATGSFVSATATKLEDTDQKWRNTPLVPTDTSEFSADVCVADEFTVVNTNDSKGAGFWTGHSECQRS